MKYPKRFFIKIYDISDYDKFDILLDQLKEKLGIIDYAICNAGLV